MVRPEVIRKRLEKLEEYLGFLERMQAYSQEEFLSDPEHYGSAERFLQLAIETVNDIANHIIAEEELGTVDASRDIPRIFRERGYIDQSLEDKWIRMIGFRNILVHDYLEVDRLIVYEVLQHELEDLRVLERVFAGFL